MNVLLLSMPDSFEHTPTVSIRMPTVLSLLSPGTLIRTTESPWPISF
jgi:hypothetical protein